MRKVDVRTTKAVDLMTPNQQQSRQPEFAAEAISHLQIPEEQEKDGQGKIAFGAILLGVYVMAARHQDAKLQIQLQN